MEIKYLNDHPICFPGPNTTVFFGAGDNKEPSNEVKTKDFALITAKRYILSWCQKLVTTFWACFQDLD